MFSVSKKQELNRVVIHLTGVIDEIARLDDLLDVIGNSRIVYLNCRNVERVTSAGTAHWMRFFNDLRRKQGVQVCLLECSAAIMGQFSFFPGFLGGMQIESFVMPFHCKDCAKAVILGQRASAVSGKLNPYELITQSGCVLKCPRCSNVLQPSFTPEEYGSFLRPDARAAA